jgi:hypothetical protein
MLEWWGWCRRKNRGTLSIDRFRRSQRAAGYDPIFRTAQPVQSEVCGAGEQPQELLRVRSSALGRALELSAQKSAQPRRNLWEVTLQRANVGPAACHGRLPSPLSTHQLVERQER